MMSAELVGLSLTVVALVLAVWQTGAALKSQRRASSQAENLARIEDSLTTRFRGEFPGFVKDIADLLERAKESIEIFHDIPGYGALSDAESWLDLRHSIERKAFSGVDVTVTLYSERRRREVLEEQVEIQRPLWAQWIHSVAMKAKLERFLKSYGDGVQLSELTPEGYVEISMAAHAKIFEEVFGQLEVNFVDDLMPMYFWMIDKREAIFAIPIFSEESSEYGFNTADSRILLSLRRMRARYVRKAAERDAR